jgi:HlyD family secretion protein
VLTIPNAALRFRPPNATENGQQANSTPSGQRRGQGRAQSNGGSAGRTASERPTQTVYVLPTDQANGTPTPVPIKTGISDGLSTEVLDGLNEGDRVVTGLLTTQSVSSPTTNPFGGRRRF